MDGKLVCSTMGLDTVDYPACEDLIEAYDGAIAAGMVAQGTQGIMQTREAANSTVEIAKDPLDPMAGHKAQRNALKSQSEFATGRSVLSGVSAGTILAFWAYLTLVSRIGANKAAYATVMFPVVALTLSSIFEGYDWELLGIVGLILVLSGNAILLGLEKNLRRVLGR